MDRRVFAAGLSLIAAGSAIAAPQCPAELTTRQELSSVHQGWKEQQVMSPHRHARITFFDGPPAEQASLAPDETRSVNGREVSTWRFGRSSTRAIWIECGYAGTSISLSQELPAETKSCSITFDPKVRLSGLPRVGKLDCR
ncbi:hypothetical protein OCUBac02_53050 (plasmid) [Bosea sp. ANAM02]|nr:hypothetical protein OCUBac02_53050 [Bosea sp. ANAM02]